MPSEFDDLVAPVNLHYYYALCCCRFIKLPKEAGSVFKCKACFGDLETSSNLCTAAATDGCFGTLLTSLRTLEVSPNYSCQKHLETCATLQIGEIEIL